MITYKCQDCDSELKTLLQRSVFNSFNRCHFCRSSNVIPYVDEPQLLERIEISTKEIFINSLKISLPVILILVSVFNLVNYNKIPITILNSFILIFFTVKLTLNILKARDKLN